jgi:hypothetical protein
LVKYVKNSDKVTIVCPVHGEFEQIAANHLKGMGCATCAGKNITTTDFITKSSALHNNKYDYSLVQYQSNHQPLNIICPAHGSFSQKATNHMNTGNGCPKCAGNHNYTSAEYIELAKLIHNNTYDYTDVNYINNRTKITINCPTHGQFEKIPTDHLYYEQGCPKCNRNTSKGEVELANFIKEFENNIQQNVRGVIPCGELDIYIPNQSIAIEYCGLYWHADIHNRIGRNYHRRKHTECVERGIQLLTIFEDEWKNNNLLVKNKIKHMLLHSTQPRVYARKTKVCFLTTKQTRTFLQNNHIQGMGPCSIRLGLKHNESIVACMTFTKYKNCHYLTRYATSSLVPGGFSKLVNHFCTTHEWKQIVSFADLRWSDGALYANNGWHLDKTLPPDYYYSPDGNRRFHKFNYRRKNLPRLLNCFDPTLSEWENCKANGILRIWDCGKQRYVLNNTNNTTNTL